MLKNAALFTTSTQNFITGTTYQYTFISLKSDWVLLYLLVTCNCSRNSIINISVLVLFLMNSLLDNNLPSCFWVRFLFNHITLSAYSCDVPLWHPQLFRLTNSSTQSTLLLVLCRVRFRLKSDTNLFEIAKCKTSVSAIEVLS